MQKQSQTAVILKLLKSQGEASNAELNRICFRYGARIYELRHEGHRIVSQHIKDSEWRFIYKGHPDDDPKPRPMFPVATSRVRRAVKQIAMFKY